MAGEHQFLDRVLTGIASMGVVPSGTTVQLDLTGAPDVTRTVATYGPGDVRALDRGAVVRFEPPPGSLGFEPNMFALVELAHPALPWLLAPTARVPWLVLVVVEDRAGVTIASTPTGRVLTIDAPASIAQELPALEDAWAWVHAYGTGATGDAIDARGFARSAGPTVARLVCPRRLAAHTRYLAVLVPATASGMRTGLGEPGVMDDGPAWTTATPLPLRLPAFADWSFTTGDGGDFASLARLLAARHLDPAGGARVVDAADPGWGIAPVSGREVTIGGLLHPQGAAVTPSAAMIDLGEAIADLVDAATTSTGDAPVFAPPAYGAHATGIESSATAPGWQASIARDVHLRAAAGFGAEIVRRRQDELVDEAWRQLGDAEHANRAIRYAELAAAVSRRMFERHVDALASDAAVLQVVAPALRRVTLGPTTVARQVIDSAVPTRTTSAAFRRQTRSGGRVGRRAGAGAASAIVARTNRPERAPDRIDVVPPKPTPHGLAAFDAISKDAGLEPRLASARASAIAANAAHWRARERGLTITPRVLARDARDGGGLEPTPTLRPPRLSHVDPADGAVVPPLPSRGGVDRRTIDAFELAARRHQQYLVEHLAAVPRQPSRPPFTRLEAVRGAIRDDLATSRTLAAALDGRVTGGTVTGAFQALSVTPVFERALVEDVKALDLSRLMPGLADIPANTVAICVPDHTAIRALLVGANHELSAELAWRRFPGSVDKLLLRTFWGRVVRDSTGAFVRAADVPPIEAWPDAGPPPPPVGLAVVIRGELLARYPSTIVSLVEAKWSGAFRILGDDPPQLPSVRIALAPDMALFAFAHDESTVLGGDSPSGPPGWYVAIEEAPHAPRFGLAASSTGALTRWRDLAWQHVVAGDLRGEHLRVDGPLASIALGADPGLRWGDHGAAQAAITLRRPTRVAIHASRLLRAGAG